MKIGVSTYSLSRAIASGEMSVLDVVQWVADQGGQHVEVVPIGFSFDDNPQLADEIRKKAEDVGIEVSNYAIGANFIANDFAQEIERVKLHVDIANRLGVKRMRHDVAFRPPGEASVATFEQDFEKIVEACRTIAAYAASYGIVTSIENHGFYVQNSERVLRIIHAVGRDNFRMTLDVGNFMCVDEPSVAAVQKCIPFASMVHLKDFYYRPSYRNPGDGWFRTTSGNYLRGAIVGQGDIDMYEVIRQIKNSGYDGYISIEFEGKEECKWGTKTALDNAIRIWNEV